MEYLIFILVNAALFIRPGEIFPDLQGVQVYLALIALCFAVCFPRVLAQLIPSSVANEPITLCLLGFWITGATANLLGQATAAVSAEFFKDFGKIVLYYLVLVGVVDNAGRLRWLLLWLGLFIVMLAGLATAHYHGLVELPGMKVLPQLHLDPQTNEWTYIRRICASGIFNDPNDLSLVLTLGSMIALYNLVDRRFGLFRVFWLLPLVLFGYTLLLTQSRGGILTLLIGLMVLLRCRLGWGKSIALGLVLLAALAVSGLRQTNVSLTDKNDTAQARIHLWAEGFELFRQSPLFGIGIGAYEDEIGQVAHNSYIQAIAETGVLGGSLFAGMVYFALWPLERLVRHRATITDPDLRRMLPFVMASVAAYATGMMSLSRNYVLPTYLVLGLSAAYQRMVKTSHPLPDQKCESLFPARLACLGMGIIVFVYVAVRTLGRFGPS
jgi:O-antigen ligase